MLGTIKLTLIRWVRDGAGTPDVCYSLPDGTEGWSTLTQLRNAARSHEDSAVRTSLGYLVALVEGQAGREERKRRATRQLAVAHTMKPVRLRADLWLAEGSPEGYSWGSRCSTLSPSGGEAPGLAVHTHEVREQAHDQGMTWGTEAECEAGIRRVVSYLSAVAGERGP